VNPAYTRVRGGRTPPRFTPFQQHESDHPAQLRRLFTQSCPASHPRVLKAHRPIVSQPPAAATAFLRFCAPVVGSRSIHGCAGALGFVGSCQSGNKLCTDLYQGLPWIGACVAPAVAPAPSGPRDRRLAVAKRSHPHLRPSANPASSAATIFPHFLKPASRPRPHPYAR